MSEPDDDPPVAVCFQVSIDEDRYRLGAFTACEGIGCEVQIEQREEGGNNDYVHQLPGRIKYGTVKLTRAVSADTAKIADWFASLAMNESSRPTARIVATTVEGKVVWEWALLQVVPVRWTGPSFSVDSAKVCTETLELAHHGFLKQG